MCFIFVGMFIFRYPWILISPIGLNWFIPWFFIPYCCCTLTVTIWALVVIILNKIKLRFSWEANFIPNHTFHCKRGISGRYVNISPPKDVINSYNKSLCSFLVKQSTIEQTFLVDKLQIVYQEGVNLNCSIQLL